MRAILKVACLAAWMIVFAGLLHVAPLIETWIYPPQTDISYHDLHWKSTNTYCWRKRFNKRVKLPLERASYYLENGTLLYPLIVTLGEELVSSNIAKIGLNDLGPYCAVLPHGDNRKLFVLKKDAKIVNVLVFKHPLWELTFYPPPIKVIPR